MSLKKIIKKASNAAISYESISALRFMYQFKFVLRDINPKAIMVTYEGHSYERAVFHLARKFNRKIKCYGYQHTILFPHQHSIKRPLDHSYNPDTIFTAGLQNQNILSKGYEGSNSSILNIGHHRSSFSKELKDIPNKDKSLDCLVLPDGNINECLDLCTFGVNTAIKNPQINFVIRLHPLNSIEMLINKNKIFKKLPNNLKITKNIDMRDDFNNSRWVLYRGSGAAIHAVMNGCIPIYISKPDSLSIDPIDEITKGKRIVSSISELNAIFANDSSMNHQEILDELDELFIFCKNYFTPFNINNLLDELKLN